MIQRNQFYKASVLVGLMIAGANMLANDSMGSSVMHVHSLVIIKNVIPNIVVDLKYATADNFTHKQIYPVAKCYLVQDAAIALKAASDECNRLGYRIKIWDGYRPAQAQYLLWELVPDERYVANPAYGSCHNRGCAVDITLITDDGIELDMGTGFDDFTELAHRDCKDFPPEVLSNRKLLQDIMERHNFVGMHTEWWHFDFADWEQYPLLDVSFDEVEG